MAGTPSGYFDWAVSRGANAYHPDQWRAEDHAVYRAWKLARVRDKWRRLRAMGYLALLTRAERIEQIRTDFADALAPVPSRIWFHCPCHKLPGAGGGQGSGTAQPWQQVSAEQVKAWVAEDPFVRSGLEPKTQGAMAYIETFKGGQ